MDIDGLNANVSTLVGGVAGIANPERLIAVDQSAGHSVVIEIDSATGLVANSFTSNTPGGGSTGGVGVVNGEIYLGTNTGTGIDVYSRAGAFLRSFNLPYSVRGLGADDNGISSTNFSLANIGGPNDDTLLGGDGEDTLFAGDFDDSLNGGAGNDSMRGGNGNDLMRGASGNDTLNGGHGEDNLNGQGGSPDTLVGSDAFDILDDNAGSDLVDNTFEFVADWIDAA